MEKLELIGKIKKIKRDNIGHVRALHKPLLILFALSQVHTKNIQYMLYSDIRDRIIVLLNQFSKRSNFPSPEEPFVRLINDGIWELKGEAEVNVNNPNNNFLIKYNISGGFNDKIFTFLSGNTELIHEITRVVLEEFFPTNLHEEIVKEIGMNIELISQKKKYEWNQGDNVSIINSNNTLPKKAIPIYEDKQAKIIASEQAILESKVNEIDNIVKTLREELRNNITKDIVIEQVNRKYISRYTDARSNPYFARVDTYENGQANTYYIGHTAVLR